MVCRTGHGGSWFRVEHAGLGHTTVSGIGRGLLNGVAISIVIPAQTLFTFIASGGTSQLIRGCHPSSIQATAIQAMTVEALAIETSTIEP